MAQKEIIKTPKATLDSTITATTKTVPTNLPQKQPVIPSKPEQPTPQQTIPSASPNVDLNETHMYRPSIQNPSVNAGDLTPDQRMKAEQFLSQPTTSPATQQNVNPQIPQPVVNQQKAIPTKPSIPSFEDMTPEQRTITEDFMKKQQEQQANQPTSTDIFTQFMTNQNPVTTNQTAYQTGLKRYKDFQTFSQMNENQLADSINNGQLMVGSKTRNDLIQSGRTDLLNAAVQTSNFRKNQAVQDYMLDAFNVNPNKSLEVQSNAFETPNLELALTQKIMQSITDASQVQTLQEQMSNNPELVKARDNARATKDKIDSLNLALRNISDDIKAQFIAKGGVPTEGYMAALVAERSKPLVRQLEALNMQYNNEVAVLGDLTDNMKENFEQEMKQREMQTQALQFGLQQVQRQEDIKRESQAEEAKFQRQLQLEQMGFDRDMAKMQAQQDFTREQSNVDYQRDLQKMDIQGQQDLAKLRMQLDNDRYDIRDGYVFDKNTGKTSTLKLPGQYTTSLGQLSLSQISQAPALAQKEALIDFADANTGLVYKYGGDGKNGIDCSGLLVAFGQATGLLKGDMNAQSMFSQSLQKGLVPLNELKPGDLIYYKDKDNRISHVGIALGPEQNGQVPILDASTNAGGVSRRMVKIDNNGRNQAGSILIGAENFMTPGGSGNINQATQKPVLNKMNAEQGKTFGFANRIIDSNKVIDEISSNFANKSLTQQSLLTNSYIPNYFKSDDAQLLDQASRDYINAVLRKESGSAISDTEFANAKKQYLPMPGDSQKVLDQKKRNRETVLKSFMQESGNYDYFQNIINQTNQ